MESPKTVCFSSRKARISVTHETDGFYWVTVKSGLYSSGRSVTVPVTVFSPNEDLAFHKAAMDVLLAILEAGEIAASDLQWMRHRSGDDGAPMLVLSRTKLA